MEELLPEGPEIAKCTCEPNTVETETVNLNQLTLKNFHRHTSHRWPEERGPTIQCFWPPR